MALLAASKRTGRVSGAEVSTNFTIINGNIRLWFAGDSS
jgi:hypothetical protein